MEEGQICRALLDLKTMEDNGKQWKSTENNGKQWKTMENNGRRLDGALLDLNDFSLSIVDIV